MVANAAEGPPPPRVSPPGVTPGVDPVPPAPHPSAEANAPEGPHDLAARVDQRIAARFGQPNRVVAAVTLAVALGLISWIVLLGFTLPPRYDAGHWPLLWIGYDVAEVAVLAFAAWAAWFRRQVLATTALVAGVLLLCDAWFDIVTSWGHRDQWVTLATGLGAEIPLAVFFLWLYRTLLMRSLATFHELAHDGVVGQRLVDTPFVFLIDETGPAAGRAGDEVAGVAGTDAAVDGTQQGARGTEPPPGPTATGPATTEAPGGPSPP